VARKLRHTTKDNGDRLFTEVVLRQFPDWKIGRESVRAQCRAEALRYWVYTYIYIYIYIDASQTRNGCRSSRMY
jgi:hypothetical protein